MGKPCGTCDRTSCAWDFYSLHRDEWSVSIASRILLFVPWLVLLCRCNVYNLDNPRSCHASTLSRNVRLDEPGMIDKRKVPPSWSKFQHNFHKIGEGASCRRGSLQKLRNCLTNLEWSISQLKEQSINKSKVVATSQKIPQFYFEN